MIRIVSSQSINLTSSMNLMIADFDKDRYSVSISKTKQVILVERSLSIRSLLLLTPKIVANHPIPG